MSRELAVMPDDPASEPRARLLLTKAQLAALLAALREDGHALLGPTVREGAIVLDRIDGLADLPVGLGDEQSPGHYRLRPRGDEALFGYVTGPHSAKRELFPPRVELFQIRRSKAGLAVVAEPPKERKLALLGARACDLHAIAIQDRVFLDGPAVDTDYAARRRGLFVIAVQCGEPAGTCFCASMGTGPEATVGFDLALTELLSGGEPRFEVEVGSPAGAALLARIEAAPASPGDRAEALAVRASARANMGRALDTEGLPALLQQNLEHPRWADVASRCLGCTSCTMVCPTCFCSTEEDVTDLSGEEATRTRRWDSCFTLEHSHVHGGSVRPSLAGRYRQWMTHKLSTWVDQFGTSGCVGCGRCLTWCPVGIDITEEAAAIRRTPGAGARRTASKEP